MMELSEREFLILIKSRLEKAITAQDEKNYNEHKDLYETYKRYKEKGMICKFYLDGDSLFLLGYFPEEYELILRKYRESGIW